MKHLVTVLTGVAVVGAWYLSRDGQAKQVGAVRPNPAGSGVSGALTAPSIGGYQVQGVSYPDTSIYAPTVQQVLSNPSSPTPANPQNSAPPYLTFNFGPAFNLSLDPAPIDVSNAQDDAYVDGGQTTLLSSSRIRQILQQPGWIDSAISNIEAYLGVEANAPQSPTLTSLQQSATLNAGSYN